MESVRVFLRPTFVVALSLLLTSRAECDDLFVVSWNVDGHRVDSHLALEQFDSFEPAQIICLQGVQTSTVQRYANDLREARGQHFRSVVSSTGDSMRLVTFFDERRFVLLQSQQLFRHKGHRLNDWTARSPLVLLLHDKVEDARLYILNVHLNEGDRDFCREQAIALEAWGCDCPEPAVAVGSFAFEYDFVSDSGNKAFDAFLKMGGNDVVDWEEEGFSWQWVAPLRFADTKWSDEDGDGEDDLPNTLDDFSFLHVPGPRNAKELLINPSGWIPVTEGCILAKRQVAGGVQGRGNRLPIGFRLGWVKKPENRTRMREGAR